MVTIPEKLERDPDSINILDILKTFGITATTNFDLLSFADFLEIDIEVVMKDEMDNIVRSYEENKDRKAESDKKLNEKGKITTNGSSPNGVGFKNNKNNYIINYQNENQKGTHWVAYKYGYYFDSFGLKPLESLEPFVVKYNREQLQFYETRICGQLCIYFLYQLEQGKPFQFIMNDFREIYNDTKGFHWYYRSYD